MTIPPHETCFCCSRLAFQHCCEPLISRQCTAATPLALIRSRYTAYVLADEAYLLATWAVATRPTTLSLGENPVKWLELIIHDDGSDSQSKEQGEVEFTARYLEKEHLVELRERSRFVLQEGHWYYLDGRTEYRRSGVGRNSACPCGSGSKFKRCCLSNFQIP